MPQEEFSMRILPNGEIILEVDGLPERRIRDLLDYIEETLGPIRIIETDDADAGGIRLRKLAAEQEGEGQGEGEKHRLRIKDER